MIELAIAYAAAHGNTEEAKNDAANIYSSSLLPLATSGDV